MQSIISKKDKKIDKFVNMISNLFKDRTDVMEDLSKWVENEND